MRKKKHARSWRSVKPKRKPKMHLRFKGRYICNWAVKADRKLMTTDYSKVTCKNCKRIIKNTRSRR